MTLLSSTIALVLIILLSLVTFSCDENPIENSEFLSINIPLNEKVIRAIATYRSTSNRDSLTNLRISSFQFNTKITSNDTTYLIGFYESLDNYAGQRSGEIVLSMTDDWVFFQNSEIFDAGIDLIKPVSSIIVDTTYLPTEYYSYFPIYPRNLLPNETYSIYRPPNEGDGWGYTGVYRQFRTENLSTWTDYYGKDAGIEVKVEHKLLDFTINFDLILDNHGIINSHSSFVQYILSPEGMLIDSARTHIVNRRIVDYSDPSSINDLSHYANEVLENGLVFDE